MRSGMYRAARGILMHDITDIDKQVRRRILEPVLEPVAPGHSARRAWVLQVPRGRA